MKYKSVRYRFLKSWLEKIRENFKGQVRKITYFWSGNWVGVWVHSITENFKYPPSLESSLTLSDPRSDNRETQMHQLEPGIQLFQ